MRRCQFSLGAGKSIASAAAILHGLFFKARGQFVDNVGLRANGNASRSQIELCFRAERKLSVSRGLTEGRYGRQDCSTRQLT